MRDRVPIAYSAAVAVLLSLIAIGLILAARAGVLTQLVLLRALVALIVLYAAAEVFYPLVASSHSRPRSHQAR